MRYIADLHLHSKYSRATSKDMVLEVLDKWGKMKGIDILGTGDFTHPLWLREIKEKLEPLGNGLFKLKDEFILDKERDKIVDAFNQALSLSINIGYPLKENIEMLISKAYNEGYGLSVEVNYPIKENIVHIIGKALSLSNILMQKIGEKNEAFKGV